MSVLNEENNKKRKALDNLTPSPKKQQQSILQYCFQKSTVAIKTVLIGSNDTIHCCPVCNVTLPDLTMIQVQSHINSCLDNCIDNTDISTTLPVDDANSTKDSTIVDDDTATTETSAVASDEDTAGITPIEDTIVISQNTDAAIINRDIVRSDSITPNTDAVTIGTVTTTTTTAAATTTISTTLNSKSSWAKLFSEATFKIRGIWSSKKEDIAPGLIESEVSWFGEPKSATVSTTIDTVKKKRPLPYYKRLAGTKMVVDAFSFGEIPDCEGYLLSHFHSDHYMGLNANWIHGPIYCSEITGRLLESKLRVAGDFIHPLPMNKPCLLSGTDGLTVTLIDANHCPGAVLFLVSVPQKKEKPSLKYLHTGDFRACPKMCLELKEPLDIVYLDTTYLDPKYSFPSQDSCINAACEVAKRHNNNNNNNNITTGIITDADLVENNNKKKIDHWFTQEEKIINNNNHDDRKKRLLVVVGTYSLGKERIFIEIAKTLNSKIFVTDQKRAILDCFHDKELNALLTNQAQDAQVHVIPLWHVLPENLEAYFHSLESHFIQMIAFRPTGWTFRASSDPQQQNRSLEFIIRARPADLIAAALKPSYESSFLTVYGVPYSEHSSYRELALFIASLDIRRIVPTVNVYSEKSRVKMSTLFEKWAQDKKKLIGNDDGGIPSVIDYPSLNHW